jgi:hypothetical protein
VLVQNGIPFRLGRFRTSNPETGLTAARWVTEWQSQQPRSTLKRRFRTGSALEPEKKLVDINLKLILGVLRSSIDWLL